MRIRHPTASNPDSTSGGFDHFKQGMSVGWTDEYNWFLPGQYVEVTGVPDGDYILDTTVDPTSRLVESDKTNNCGAVRVRLSQMGTINPQAELLGQARHAARADPGRCDREALQASADWQTARPDRPVQDSGRRNSLRKNSASRCL